MKELQETPSRAVVDGRVAAYGYFKDPFTHLNLLDARIPLIPGFLRKYRLKEWQHFAVITPEYFMGFVVNTAHYLAVSFCYAARRDTGEIVEHHADAGPGAAKLSRELLNSRCLFEKKGYRIEVENRLKEGFHKARLEIAPTRKIPGIEAEFSIWEDLAKGQPLITILPVSENRPLYTHKMVCPASGWLKVGDRRVTLDKESALVMVDVQKTFYPFSTEWRWATFAGHDGDGNQLALNLVRNMIPEPHNENCLWVNGEINFLGEADFDFDPGNVTAPWRVSTRDGKVDILLTPQNERAGKINLGLIMSDYHAPFGAYSGTVKDAKGRAYTLGPDCFGVAEHHRARF